MNSKPLYTRLEHYIPRIAAVHDLCGYGKCSLGIAIPVLSAAGCDVCPVPTGLFSSHTAMSGWYMYDTTEMLGNYIEAWDKTDIEIDAIYSGFLGDAKQVDIIMSLYRRFPNALRIVDPVMADHGQIYPTYTDNLCQAMVELASQAHILTPNLTEAAIITGQKIGEEWEGENIDDARATEIVNALLDCGAQNVVLKGIKREKENTIHNYIGSKNFNTCEVCNNYLDYQLHGTGDLYCSCLLAAIMSGKNLIEAADFAGNFVYEAILVSTKQPGFIQRGVSFELILNKVCTLLK